MANWYSGSHRQLSERPDEGWVGKPTAPHPRPVSLRPPVGLVTAAW
jgi:hypothetical protein